MDALHDFAARYHTLRSSKLAELADAAAARGDQELADLFRAEVRRKLDVIKPDLRLLPPGGSTTSS